MTAPTPFPDSALGRFREAVRTSGTAGRLAGPERSAARGHDTLDWPHPAAAPLVLLLESEDEIRAALDLARREKLSIHPVSSGHNWGYGTARPASADTRVLFDLSPMKRILAFDPDLGVITVEPGVTQGQLEAYLAGRGAEFMVPTTGAGPDCSLVGNALERGYGMTPVADHFQAVLGLTAVLADGSLYRSPFPGASPDQTGPAGYRWGSGPYLDGLFSQNGGAVVTSLTLQLMPRPAAVEMFVFWLKDDADLERTIAAMRGLLTRSGLSIGGINLMNAARVGALAGEAALKGAPWIGTGVVYGDTGVVRAGRKVLRRALKPVAARLAFVNSQRLRLAETLARLPFIGRSLSPVVAPVRSAYRMLAGHPGEFALALAYGAAPRAMPHSRRDPARDGCGLLWYAPIVPMEGRAARRYIDMVARICAAHGFAAPITFSTLSVSAFDSTVPLLFPRDRENSDRALACLRALIAEGRRLGFPPYRFHSGLMDEATAGNDAYWQLAGRVQSALDPDGLISPGRYRRRPPADALAPLLQETLA
ncbi:FAD-binding protein [Microvirga tunisiensis]|uniref:FAD-binding protein n=1 Tax=Pannonibacter tanglangensis TaxID=2750084 RepID=A0A7X5J787_9HYPH|nr:FAD-binding protein [Pannonibacter sp. XCT-53]